MKKKKQTAKEKLAELPEKELTRPALEHMKPLPKRFRAPMKLTCRYCGSTAGYITQDVPERIKVPLSAFSTAKGDPITSPSQCRCSKCGVNFYDELTDKVWVNGFWS